MDESSCALLALRFEEGAATTCHARADNGAAAALPLPLPTCSVGESCHRSRAVAGGDAWLSLAPGGGVAEAARLRETMTAPSERATEDPWLPPPPPPVLKW